MRPEILFPLFGPVTGLQGVGPKTAKLIARAAGERVADLVWHLPSGFTDRRYRPRIADAAPGSVATIAVNVLEHIAPRGPRQPWRVRVSDETAIMDLVFFGAQAEWLKALLPPGSQRWVSGKIETFQDRPQMAHPDHVLPPDKIETLPAVEPVYPGTEGLASKALAKAIRDALLRLPDMPEWQDQAWLARNHWPGWQQAVRKAHAPDTAMDLEPASPARARLAYDELLANQLALALARSRMKVAKGRALSGDGRLRSRLIAALPYRLTAAQEQAAAEIAADMAAPHRMMRLLQGDVGAGKTLVAMLAMLSAVEAGAQAALMAPTEILARQHAASLAPLATAAGVRLAVLTGREKGRPRLELLGALAAGEIAIIVGTHALLSDDVAFQDLGLVVIDEQHRFGVHQRMALGTKGPLPADVLVMTATPIPRTLALTAYGDMDVSRLAEKPPGRKPVDTRTVPLTRLGEVVEAVARAAARNEAVFWVCPLVEESEVLDVAAAEERYGALLQRLPGQVGLVHGRMPARERDSVMESFRAGALRVLVATTVIEVGVDVPDATVIVIEHAERFGLAQLHQLRGRVGRGDKPSTCVLLYQAPLGETARARLAVLRESNDGFRIAEEDLKLRGAGELLGTRQSGLPVFRLASLEHHHQLLIAARDDAQLIMARDPALQTERGAALRVLLYLFEQDEAVRRMKAG